jgi:hypothetical protein
MSFESSKQPLHDVVARVANRPLVLRISSLTKKVCVYQVLFSYNKESYSNKNNLPTLKTIQ